MTVPVTSVVERLPGLRTALVLATVVGVSSLAVDASAQQAGMPGGDTEIHVLPVQFKAIPSSPPADEAQPGEGREEQGQRGGEGDGRGCCKYP